MPKVKQRPLIDIDPYGEFPGYEGNVPRFPEDYPFDQFKPLDPAFIRKGEVLTGGRRSRRTYVDLSIGECECGFGYAWRWDSKGEKWFAGGYCSHKLRMICSIIDNVSNPVEHERMRRAYLKAVSTRYNRFEVVSAFHKELRRGDFEKAWFWGLMLANFRGTHGVFHYLLNIVYEETRDHELAAYLLKVRNDPRQRTIEKLSQAISWFCASKKKWELPHRYDIFLAEMRGYEKLAKEFGPDVAKGGNIIAPEGAKEKFLKYMEEGLLKSDHVQFQRGLKGLQKLRYTDKENPKPEDLNDHRYWLYERLYDLADEHLPDSHGVWTVISVVNDRILSDHGIGYHELNAIADALMGEPTDSGLLSPTERKRAVARPPAKPPVGIWPKIPLYASDNHTYLGKALLRRYPDQLKPKAEQTDLDFRWCGAYFGVAYRMLAFRQHGSISEWHEVDWPKELYRIVNILWY